MEKQLDKQIYINVVKKCLKIMKDLSKRDPDYDLSADIKDYFDKKIKPEGVLTENEFLDLYAKVSYNQVFDDYAEKSK